MSIKNALEKYLLNSIDINVLQWYNNKNLNFRV
jgi:hypothetical protein